VCWGDFRGKPADKDDPDRWLRTPRKVAIDLDLTQKAARATNVQVAGSDGLTLAVAA